MKKALLIAVLGLLAASFVSAEYNSEVVVAVMRANVAHMQAATADAESGNYFGVATNMMEMAKGMESIKGYQPYRGTPASWQENIQNVIDTAFLAVGACGARDDMKIQEYLGRLWELNKEGHGAHK